MKNARPCKVRFLSTHIYVYMYKVGRTVIVRNRRRLHPLPTLSPPPPGRIKVLGVQAATDSYIYTFRGFSISRFVECTRLGLTRRGAARRAALQITSGGFVSVRSCGGVRYVPGCQARLRKSPSVRRAIPCANSADSNAGLRLRMGHVTYLRADRFQASPMDKRR